MGNECIYLKSVLNDGSQFSLPHLKKLEYIVGSQN